VIELGQFSYGKSAIRLVKVDRDRIPHRVRDLTIDIELAGEFVTSYTEGDNSGVIATDTMKNTVYALAGEHLTGSIEEFGWALGRHFLGEPQVDLASVKLAEHSWRPIGPSPDAFARDGSFTRTASVWVERTQDGFTPVARAGFADLSVMKTTRSSFAGFPRDQFTTLKETDDRIMATKVTADWLYEVGRTIDFDASYEGIRSTFLEVFAEHQSVSVQASIWIIGKAILERHPEVNMITMTMPNLHHWTVDLRPFGIENDRQIYVATAEPYGLIQATVERNQPHSHDFVTG
jgi:urate oxidase